MSAQDQTHAADRIYYDAPEVLEFTAVTTAVREMARVDGKQVWQVALNRTAFYPTSGGQPSDTGVLTAASRSGAVLTAPITDVQESADGEVWHTTSKPLQEGTTVRGVIDANRRHDHMQQHSGQHLLSALLWQTLGAKTVGFHLGPAVCTIDIQGRPLSAEAMAEIELQVNAVVAQALPVQISYVAREQAEEMLSSGLLRKLPPREGSIRLIAIPGIDLNACGGTHVATTAAIGPVLLRGTERVRDSVRVQFVCGGRAIRAAREDFSVVTALAHSLSTSVADVSASVARLQAAGREGAKQRYALLQSLAEMEAKALALHPGPPDAAVFVHLLDAQQAGRNAAYARLLALQMVNTGGRDAALVAVQEGDRSSVVLAARVGGLDCNGLLRQALQGVGGRGGGTHELAQGSLPTAAFAEFLRSIQSVTSTAN